VSGAFGGPVGFHSGAGEDGTSSTTAHQDMDLVRNALRDLKDGGAGFLRLYRPRPTAAFSPCDMTLEHYALAADAMKAKGFEPVERRAGGQLAVYDGNALVVDLVAPHADPRAHVIERFRLFSTALASTLSSLGVDARVGGIDGEYCRGDYSVNSEGRIKLAGVAQRIGRRGYHLGAVISVMPSARAGAAVNLAYRILGLHFNPATFGAVANLVPDLSSAVLFQRLQDAVAGELIALQGAKRKHVGNQMLSPADFETRQKLNPPGI
jgi:octanoyl-[GcvH]:protein N-octanoyltransferase